MVDEVLNHAQAHVPVIHYVHACEFLWSVIIMSSQLALGASAYMLMPWGSGKDKN
jgi:hypothetical protein